MPYCTVSDVKAAISFPTSSAPVSDANILDFILDSQDEINYIYKTTFGSTEDSGTASAGANTSLTDSTKTWTANDYEDMVVKITGGTGSGQYRSITSNTTDTLTVSVAWDTNPDATSTYKILNLRLKTDTVDGNGTNTQFTKKQPLVSLQTLSIDSTTVTPGYVYTEYSGRLRLSVDAEVQYFTDTYPQLVTMSYIYGVEDFPRVIKRLCVILTALRTLTSQIAGTYDDFTAITLPGITGSKGEPYTNIRESINKLQSEAKAIIGDVEQGVQLEAKGWRSYRPLTYFG